jgi:hypothetical protein
LDFLSYVAILRLVTVKILQHLSLFCEAFLIDFFEVYRDFKDRGSEKLNF